MDKYQLVSVLQRNLLNPVVKALLLRGFNIPGYAVLETTGRKSGQARQTPVGDGLVGDTFWIVAEHGNRAAYVRNLTAHPRVRVRVGGTWRTGTAHTMPEDDSRERQRKLGDNNWNRRMNAAVVRLMGTDLLTIRIDLDPHESAG